MLVKTNTRIVDMIFALNLVHFFSCLSFDLGKNVVIFGVGNSLSEHVNNKTS